MPMAEVIDLIKYVLGGWQVTVAAPVIFAGIIIVILAIWGAMRWRYGGIIEKRDASIAVFEDRLKLAAEKVELADRAKDNVEKQLHAYKEEAAGGAANEALVKRMVKLEDALDKLVAANNAVSSAIGVSARISAGSSMNVSLSPVGESSVTDTISDLYSNTPLPLRQAEADKGGPK